MTCSVIGLISYLDSTLFSVWHLADIEVVLAWTSHLFLISFPYDTRLELQEFECYLGEMVRQIFLLGRSRWFDLKSLTLEKEVWFRYQAEFTSFQLEQGCVQLQAYEMLDSYPAWHVASLLCWIRSMSWRSHLRHLHSLRAQCFGSWITGQLDLAFRLLAIVTVIIVVVLAPNLVFFLLLFVFDLHELALNWYFQSQVLYCY